MSNEQTFDKLYLLYVHIRFPFFSKLEMPIALRMLFVYCEHKNGNIFESKFEFFGLFYCFYLIKLTAVQLHLLLIRIFREIFRIFEDTVCSSETD